MSDAEPALLYPQSDLQLAGERGTSAPKQTYVGTSTVPLKLPEQNASALVEQPYRSSGDQDDQHSKTVSQRRFRWGIGEPRFRR
jgi:hypothetical protein